MEMRRPRFWRRGILGLTALSLVGGSAGPAGATSYYVDKDAKGKNSGGSWANAWQSPTRINWSAVQPGDTVEISGGRKSKTYYGRVRVGKSGTAGNLITIRGSGEQGHAGEVIIDGRDEKTTESGGLGPWTQVSRDVYSTPLGFKPGYVGDVRRGTRFASPLQDDVKFDHFMVASAEQCLAPGNWCVVGDAPPYTLYVYCRDLGKGANPAKYRITLPRHMNGFNLQGGKGYIRLARMTVRYSTDNGVACGRTVGSEFRRLNVYGHRITGVYFLDSDNKDNLVADCAFANNGHCGVEMMGDENTSVRRCRFYSTGAPGGGNAAHIAFPRNTRPRNITIENCVFERTGSPAYDPDSWILSGINLFGTQIDNLVVRHNTFYGWRAAAFSSTHGGGNYTFASNVFYADNSESFLLLGRGIAAAPTGTYTITDNIFYGTAASAFSWRGPEYPFAQFKEKVEGAGGVVSGNLFQDPELANVSTYDLRPKPGSPCIDAAPDAGAKDSYDGTPRPAGKGHDIGAYEHREKE